MKARFVVAACLLQGLLQSACHQATSESKRATTEPKPVCQQPSPAVASAGPAMTVTSAAPDTAAQGEPRDQTRSYFDLEFRRDDTKYAVEGPFYIGDPVHETITLLAAHDAGYSKAERAADVPELIRGVFWNDDPCAQLFDDRHEGLGKSSGLEWYLDFRAAGKSAKEGKPLPKLTCPLLGRSHFGDLQFFHGMANGDGIDPQVTHKLVMSWLRFTYALASGDLDTMSEFKAVAPEIDQLIKLGPEATSADLFYATSRPIAQERALGSMLHLIQDSFAAGHTNRKTVDGCRGEIVQFYSYAKQDHGKHSEDDSWRGSGAPRERVNAIQGGKEALQACQEVLSMKQAKRPWADIEQYLLSGPMRLSAQAVVSGPGQAFQKN